MPSSFTLLMHNILLKPFSNRKVIDKQEPVESFDRLTLDLAVTSNIDQSLIEALRKIQSYVQEKLDAEVFILSPITHRTRSWLHSNHISPSTKLLAQISNQLPQLPRSPASSALSSTESLFHFEPIHYGKHTDSQDQQTWLVLMFKRSKPSGEKIQFYMEQVIRALEEGIGAWKQQQIRVQQAEDKVTAAYAAELHDTLAQTLGFLRIKSCRLTKECQSLEEQTKALDIAEEISSQVKLAYRQTRDIITTSRTRLEEGNLSQLINQAIEDFEQRSSIVFEVDNRVGASLKTSDDSQVLFIVREALSNTVRHAKASHARVIIRQQNNSQLLIRIEDNGRGIQATEKRHDCFGLNIMRERAEKISATFTISARDGGGTRIDLNIPEGNL